MKRKPEADIAQALELTALCQTFNCLPRPGGLYDQDPRDIFIMREVLMVQAEKQEIENKRK